MPTLDTKTALLNSAENAARTLGFDGFSYADLAEDVGIRKASIHHHFPTKAKLSVALMQRYHEAFQAIGAEIIASNGTGGTQLSALIDQYRTGSNGGKQLCLCASFSASRDSLPDDVLQQINLFRTMVIDWMTAAFKKGRTDGSITGVSEPQLESAAALSLLEGAQLAARSQENPELFETAVKLLSMRIQSS
ncbi:TetR/AcrR family transcriptional repressor of nem operon [Sulfitobacter undariae]|uniref:TetR/AcrR family transcriptional repressor of nem operon n=1 Tax=Sulfitobacter undariae TaxID=1563671 RepID=A0A7W6EB61_9RHOB|nr:TetR/AcrR family transcriptional regulator [Sulfitobacter undariae]MBB3995997.1 TetR/AcrR family transcriptional repressor of nem operon [Sulfitobacter undariae]